MKFLSIDWKEAKQLILDGKLTVIGSNLGQINNQGEFTISETGDKLYKKRNSSTGNYKFDLIAKKDSNKTFDVVFHSNDSSAAKGFEQTFEYCKDYIETWNGSNHSYFEDYKGGVVVIVENGGNGDPVYSADIAAA